jgi:hypothetical protein
MVQTPGQRSLPIPVELIRGRACVCRGGTMIVTFKIPNGMETDILTWNSETLDVNHSRVQGIKVEVEE